MSHDRRSCAAYCLALKQVKSPHVHAEKEDNGHTLTGNKDQGTMFHQKV